MANALEVCIVDLKSRRGNWVLFVFCVSSECLVSNMMQYGAHNPNLAHQWSPKKSKKSP